MWTPVRSSAGSPLGPFPCPGCAQGTREWARKDGLTLWGCGACGTISCDDVSETSGLYDHYYDHAAFQAPEVVAASLERLVRSAERFRKAGRWLDVGYGEGGLLEGAAAQGWACHGTEISPPALEHGRARGWIVSARPDEDPRFAAGSFDVVTMIELLEHVRDPARVLAAAARWLRPGGLLYVTTPNARSLNRWLLGARWSVFSPPEHLTVWTAQGLSRALASAGFREIEVRTEGLNPVEVLARFRPRRPGGAPSVSRNEAALRLSVALSRSAARRAAKRAINAALNATGLGDTLKVAAVRAR